MAAWNADYSGFLLFALDDDALPVGRALAARSPDDGRWVYADAEGRRQRLRPGGHLRRDMPGFDGRPTGIFHIYGGVYGEFVGRQDPALDPGEQAGLRTWFLAPDSNTPVWVSQEGRPAGEAVDLPESPSADWFVQAARDFGSGSARLQGHPPLAPSRLLERNRQLVGLLSDTVGPRPPSDALDCTFLMLSNTLDPKAAHVVVPIGGSHGLRHAGRTGIDPFPVSVEIGDAWSDAEAKLRTTIGLTGDPREAGDTARMFVVAVDASGDYVIGRPGSDGPPEWMFNPRGHKSGLLPVRSAAPIDTVEGAAANALWLASHTDTLRRDHPVSGVEARAPKPMSDPLVVVLGGNMSGALRDLRGLAPARPRRPVRRPPSPGTARPEFREAPFHAGGPGRPQSPPR